MTVKELISELEKMPQDMEVHDDNTYRPVKDVFIDFTYISGQLTEVVFIR